ncbi:MAG: hypothetical protein QF596_07235 [Acidimicrobiales bacterium]|jgi:hypothetical protein|nr:hypothetical protein [Acidimicrobiales bacterium]MDP6299501.1 hypothetical protein [Acidimicrobiales bacterium]HJM28042.1 hypothetical protein [Acidimicrobiales bacterium]HJM96611.1 hypothetical protein [Acidimicrobiales bacterium]
MAESTSFLFTNTVRTLSTVVRERGYNVPAFKGPPSLGEHSRTLRRNRDGSMTISVVFRGRAWLSTLSDIVEGFVVANSDLNIATQLRDLLWSVIEERELSKVEGGGISPPYHSLNSAA